MEIPLLKDIVIIFALSAVVILLFHRLKIPPIIGFLVTGILIGPSGILHYSFGADLIQNSHNEIDHLAEIGVVLLLFTIGIEFSIKNLITIRKTVLIGGSVQVGLSIALSYIIASLFGYGFGEALYMGFLLALSSTAIVLKTLQKDNQITTPNGKASLGILIFQDIIIVPMMLFVPILAGNTGNVGLSLLLLILKAAGLIIFTFGASRWVVPKILHEVAKTGSKELFLLTLLLFGFAVAWLTSAMGLSLALGAFLAGLAISESDYSHHAFGNIIPFRDIFTAFFFVSVGMLLDVQFIVAEPVNVLVFVFFILLIKTIVSGFATFMLGYPFRTTVIVGLSLSQIGEFSFVLSEIGLKNGFLISPSTGDYYYQLFLSVTTTTMILTPFIIMIAPWLSGTLVKILPLPDKFINGLQKVPGSKPVNPENHLIIVGLGFNGTSLCKAASVANIQHIAIESDADIVKEKQKQGVPVIYGDATYESVLEAAGIDKAQILVSVIEDPSAIYNIVRIARSVNPELYIIARTRYINDVEDLYKVGANEVIPEEFETSLEIFARVLNKYLIPKTEIDKLVTEFRSHGYGMLREPAGAFKEKTPSVGQDIPDVEIASIKISDRSKLIDKSLAETGIREKYGITVLAIRRNEQTIPNPGSNEIFKPEDILYIMGDHEHCIGVNELFR